MASGESSLARCPSGLTGQRVDPYYTAMTERVLLLALSSGLRSSQPVLALNDDALTRASPGGESWRLVVAGKPGEDEILPVFPLNEATVLVTDTEFARGMLAARLPSLGEASILFFDPERDLDLIRACASIPQIIPLPIGASAMRPAMLILYAEHALSARAASLARQEELRAVGARYLNLVRALPDLVYVLDEDGHFAYLNDAVRVLGYETGELIGKHFAAILHPDDREHVSRKAVVDRIRNGAREAPTPPKLFDERRSGPRMTRDLEVRLLAKDGSTIFYGSVNSYGEQALGEVGFGAPLAKGPVTMGVVRDVSAARAYRISLEENLAAKELLLREIHHRVKNNLQVVASLAHLREMELGDSAAKESMRAMIAQVRSMAMVHEALYQSENLSGVYAADYLNRFARFMDQSYGLLGRPIALEVEADNTLVDVDILTNLALIANELVSNAYKHAFPHGREGRISIRFDSSEKEYLLRVEDNGVGLSVSSAREMDLPGLEPTRGPDRLGLDVVKALARQLGATLDWGTGPGTSVMLRMPKSSQSKE
jgi:PAS domain S-box-containing protein